MQQYHLLHCRKVTETPEPNNCTLREIARQHSLHMWKQDLYTVGNAGTCNTASSGEGTTWHAQYSNKLYMVSCESKFTISSHHFLQLQLSKYLTSSEAVTFTMQTIQNRFKLLMDTVNHTAYHRRSYASSLTIITDMLTPYQPLFSQKQGITCSHCSCCVPES